MPIGIGSNIAGLKAQRRLSEGTSALTKSYEQLSSGQRINQASDDAAGLAIATALNSRAKVYGQAVRNANDGLSLYAIADSAVSSLTDINTRLQELASQAANGVYSTTQRQAMDAEAQALSKEYFRISRAAQFNGQRLFDGSMSNGLTLQLGYGTSGTISGSVGGKLGDGTVAVASSFTSDSSYTNDVALADLNGDGILDMATIGSNGSAMTLTVRAGDGRGGFSSAAVYTESGYTWNALALGDLNGDGALDIVLAGARSSAGRAMVFLNSGNGTFARGETYSTETDSSYAVSLGDLNNDGIPDLVTAGQGTVQGNASVRLGTGKGTFGAMVTTFKTENSSSRAISLGDIDNDGKLDIVTAGVSGAAGRLNIALGNGDGTVQARVSYATEASATSALALGDLNGDGRLDVVTGGLGSSLSAVTVRMGAGGTTLGTAVSYSTGLNNLADLALADLNGDGSLDLLIAGGQPGNALSLRLGSRTGSLGALTFTGLGGGELDVGGEITTGDVNGDGVTDVINVVSSYSYTTFSNSGEATVLFGNTRDGISPLQPFSLQSKGDALQALGLFSRTAQNLADMRGTLGAVQSRVNTALGGLVTARESFLAAESRIREVDVTQESASLTTTQIRQQAAAAVLAQANLAPQLALRLLS